jgi:hypothetical protein
MARQQSNTPFALDLLGLPPLERALSHTSLRDAPGVARQVCLAVRASWPYLHTLTHAGHRSALERLVDILDSDAELFDPSRYDGWRGSWRDRNREFLGDLLIEVATDASVPAQSRNLALVAVTGVVLLTGDGVDPGLAHSGVGTPRSQRFGAHDASSVKRTSRERLRKLEQNREQTIRMWLTTLVDTDISLIHSKEVVNFAREVVNSIVTHPRDDRSAIEIMRDLINRLNTRSNLTPGLQRVHDALKGLAPGMFLPESIVKREFDGTQKGSAAINQLRKRGWLIITPKEAVARGIFVAPSQIGYRLDE